MTRGKRIGIVGGGQLGRMLTIPAKQMGFEITVVDPTENCPASQVGARQIIGSLTDQAAINELASQTDIVTFEIEHINTEALKELAHTGTLIHPSPHTLEKIKDKFAQKTFLKENGIPTAESIVINSNKDALQAGELLGYPFLLKARQGGYDGRGNAVVKTKTDISIAMKKLGNVKLYAEKYISFTKELAVMVARSVNGDIKTYPVVETLHENNILHTVLAPAPIPAVLQKEAQQFAIQLMQHLQGAGVFGIEMFLTEDKQILVNEIAPRVHNSGHYTTEACRTSQFEQHIRAIAGLPLGDTGMRVPVSVMVNILGDHKNKASLKGLEQVLALPNTSVHIYGKAETKPERKMGHITVTGDSLEECLSIAKMARKALSI